MGREALLRYVLRPAVAQERVEQRPDGLVREQELFAHVNLVKGAPPHMPIRAGGRSP